jgi:hypothetical protein
MSSNAATPSRRIGLALVAIAVTALLHGGWLADVNGPQRGGTAAARIA